MRCQRALRYLSDLTGAMAPEDFAEYVSRPVHIIDLSSLTLSAISIGLSMIMAWSVPYMTFQLPVPRFSDISDYEHSFQSLERLATLSPTPSEIVDKVIAVVLGKAQRAVARPLTHPGGVRVAAAMLNAMNKEASKNILTTLEENNPDLGASIKQKMFTFEDLIHLDAQDVQKILRDVDMKDLAMAMKNVPETLINFILSCMSKRAGEGVLEEMEFLTNAKAKDIEAAQLSVVETVRRLEGNDEIDLSVMGGGG